MWSVGEVARGRQIKIKMRIKMKNRKKFGMRNADLGIT